MKKRLFVSGCLILTLLAFFSSQAAAEIIWRAGAMTVEDELTEEGGRINIGNLKIIPGLKLGGTYDDNIYMGNGYTNSTPDFDGQITKPIKSDYIFHVMPGLLLNYALPKGRGNINLGYEGDWAFYRHTTAQNWNNQRVLFNGDYTAPAGLIFKLSNVFDSGNDPYGDAVQFGLGLTKQRWKNDLTAKVGWDFFNRFKVLGYYNFYKQKYKGEQDFTQNWTGNEFGIGFETRVLPKTWAFVRYHYGMQNFDTNLFGTTDQNNASNKLNSINAGLAWDGGGKLGGELNFGWGWLNFDNDYDPNGNKYENKNTWIAGTSIDYEVFPKTRLTLNIARAMKPTGADKQEYYDDTNVGINIGQDLPYKFSATAGFIYGRNDYNTPVNPVSLITADRVDNNYNANVSFRYMIRTWLDASLGYRYMKKESNDITQGFTDNQVMLSIGASY